MPFSQVVVHPLVTEYFIKKSYCPVDVGKCFQALNHVDVLTSLIDLFTGLELITCFACVQKSTRITTRLTETGWRVLINTSQTTSQSPSHRQRHRCHLQGDLEKLDQLGLGLVWHVKENFNRAIHLFLFEKKLSETDQFYRWIIISKYQNIADKLTFHNLIYSWSYEIWEETLATDEHTINNLSMQWYLHVGVCMHACWCVCIVWYIVYIRFHTYSLSPKRCFLNLTWLIQQSRHACSELGWCSTHLLCMQGGTGADGPKGDTGEPGPQGIAGDTGPQGASGAQGQNGSIGPSGPQGSPGFNGSRGATGEIGPVGEKGDTGDAGERGPAGVVPTPGSYCFHHRHLS